MRLRAHLNPLTQEDVMKTASLFGAVKVHGPYPTVDFDASQELTQEQYEHLKHHAHVLKLVDPKEQS
jgi:hypothetical protein